MPMPLPQRRIDPDHVQRPASGIWTIDGDSLVNVESFDAGPAVVLVPTEAVLLLAVDLPIANPRRRAEALPFAIEDRIAQGLADVHVALGRDVAPQRHLAGVVAHDLMARWVDLLSGLGLTRAAIVPDVLALPVPPAAAWSVDLAGGRALVRADDGTGFAVASAHLAAAWALAARPRMISYGEALPADLGAEAGAHEADGLAGRLVDPALDLRQGAYAAPRRAVSPLWRRIAGVAAAGALAHAAIAAADTLALRHIAATREAETRALVAAAAPGAVIGDDVAASVADLLPAQAAGASGFLPLFGRVGAALKPLSPAVRMRSIAYDASGGTMSVEVEADSMDALAQVGAAFARTGLSAQPGAASQTAGRGVGAFLIRGAAA